MFMACLIQRLTGSGNGLATAMCEPGSSSASRPVIRRLKQAEQRRTNADDREVQSGGVILIPTGHLQFQSDKRISVSLLECNVRSGTRTLSGNPQKRRDNTPAAAKTTSPQRGNVKQKARHKSAIQPQSVAASASAVQREASSPPNLQQHVFAVSKQLSTLPRRSHSHRGTNLQRRRWPRTKTFPVCEFCGTENVPLAVQRIKCKKLVRFVEHLSMLQLKRKYGFIDYGEDDQEDIPQMVGQTGVEFQLEEVTPVYSGDTADILKLILASPLIGQRFL